MPLQYRQSSQKGIFAVYFQPQTNRSAFEIIVSKSKKLIAQNWRQGTLTKEMMDWETAKTKGPNILGHCIPREATLLQSKTQRLNRKEKIHWIQRTITFKWEEYIIVQSECNEDLENKNIYIILQLSIGSFSRANTINVTCTQKKTTINVSPSMSINCISMTHTDISAQ